jgi:hypothetical protein
MRFAVQGATPKLRLGGDFGCSDWVEIQGPSVKLTLIVVSTSIVAGGPPIPGTKPRVPHPSSAWVGDFITSRVWTALRDSRLSLRCRRQAPWRGRWNWRSSRCALRPP